MEVFPDGGCQESLVSWDLVGPLGLVLDRRRKTRIQAINGAKVTCLGSTKFQITYDGQTTNVLALVTTALSDEIVLSWRALQRLKVLPEDFPRAQTTVKANQVQSPKVHGKDSNTVFRRITVCRKVSTKVHDGQGKDSNAVYRKAQKRMKSSRSVWSSGGVSKPELQRESIAPNPNNDFILEPRCGSNNLGTSDGPLRPSLSAASAKGLSVSSDGTREFTRNQRFIRPAATPSPKSKHLP